MAVLTRLLCQLPQQLDAAHAECVREVNEIRSSLSVISIHEPLTASVLLVPPSQRPLGFVCTLKTEQIGKCPTYPRSGHLAQISSG